MDTNKPSSDIDDIPSCRRDDIIPFVLLHQARRDQAVLGRPGTRALNLYAYYRKRQGEVVTQLAQAAFLRSLVTEVQAEIHRLIDGADTPEKRREILPQVQRLHALVSHSRVAMEKLVK